MEKRIFSGPFPLGYQKDFIVKRRRLAGVWERSCNLREWTWGGKCWNVGKRAMQEWWGPDVRGQAEEFVFDLVAKEPGPKLLCQMEMVSTSFLPGPPPSRAVGVKGDKI